FGVNRHAVREAVKRLQQAGLVHVAQGGATRVLPWRESGGLELLADLPIPDGPQGAAIVRGILEMRESIGVDAARRCATRVPAELADAEGVAPLVAAIEGGDPDAAAAAARRLLGVTVRVALGRAAA